MKPAPSFRLFGFQNVAKNLQILTDFSVPHLYRICLYDQSYELSVMTGAVRGNLTRAAVVPSGSCADIEALVVGIEYRCRGVGRHCFDRPPIYQACRKNGHIQRYGTTFGGGWSIATDDFAPSKFADQYGPIAIVHINQFVPHEAVPGAFHILTGATNPRTYAIGGAAGMTAWVDGVPMVIGNELFSEVVGKNIELAWNGRKPSGAKIIQYFIKPVSH